MDLLLKSIQRPKNGGQFSFSMILCSADCRSSFWNNKNCEWRHALQKQNHRTTIIRGCAILDEICDNLDINKKNMSEKLFFMEQKWEKLKEDLTRYIDFSMDCIIVLGVENWIITSRYYFWVFLSRTNLLFVNRANPIAYMSILNQTYFAKTFSQF